MAIEKGDMTDKKKIKKRRTQGVIVWHVMDMLVDLCLQVKGPH